MVGMGETEKEMVTLMDHLWRMGVDNHLFSFFCRRRIKLWETGLSRHGQPT